MSARYALAICESCEGSGETETESHRMDCPDCLGTGYTDPHKRILNLIMDLIEAGKQRDTYAAALREIMINEEGLHRMGYNPYLIANAALKGGQHD
jgi:PHP family Zn ribbon phosphoesterase